MAFQNLTTVDLLSFITYENLAWIEIHWYSICWGPQSHMTSHYTWGPMTMLHDYGSVLGQRLGTPCGLSEISWSRLLACVRSGPKGYKSNSSCLYNTLDFLATSHSDACLLLQLVFLVGRIPICNWASVHTLPTRVLLGPVPWFHPAFKQILKVVASIT
jgi:hypothetical protein